MRSGKVQGEGEEGAAQDQRPPPRPVERPSRFAERVAEANPARSERTSFLKARAGPAWQELPSSSQARRTILNGVRTHFKRRAPLHGFHQSMPARLDMENIDRRIVEIHRLIRNGV